MAVRNGGPGMPVPNNRRRRAELGPAGPEKGAGGRQAPRMVVGPGSAPMTKTGDMCAGCGQDCGRVSIVLPMQGPDKEGLWCMGCMMSGKLGQKSK